MNTTTSEIIKELRQRQNLTQKELADIIGVSDTIIADLEEGKGLPDTELIEKLSKALNISIIELINGKYITNTNTAGNMLKSKFSVCPICQNIIHSLGESVNCCCGITLQVLEPIPENEKHTMNCEMVENEYYVSMTHGMTKEHYMSFIAYVTDNRCEIVKLYPEQTAEARFLNRGKGKLYAYCNLHGLFEKKI
ncbi:MAG: helix-turn-helix domain-containing protein [Clostridiales bacterium]|nr:helix-turn-helix domain-containing protein [Clostridiales bacterium]